MKLLRILNRQKTRLVNVVFLRRVTACLLQELIKLDGYELAVHLVEPSEMMRLNETFLGHEGSTDVITFDNSESRAGIHGARGSGNRQTGGLPHKGATELCGEIFISVADAAGYARTFRSTWQSEVARYVVHGVLHLRGYDDIEPGLRRVMKRQENRLLKALAVKFDLSQFERLQGHPKVNETK